MHKTTDHLANQNNSNELDTTSLERAQDLELVQDKFQIENLFNTLFLLFAQLKSKTRKTISFLKGGCSAK
jgi:hypothetical protein